MYLHEKVGNRTKYIWKCHFSDFTSMKYTFSSIIIKEVWKVYILYLRQNIPKRCLIGLEGAYEPSWKVTNPPNTKVVDPIFIILPSFLDLNLFHMRLETQESLAHSMQKIRKWGQVVLFITRKKQAMNILSKWYDCVIANFYFLQKGQACLCG